MADAIAQNILCKICGETKNLKRCGTCKQVYYCSREHQLKDWKEHKEICESFKSSRLKSQSGTASMVYRKGDKCNDSKENLNIGKVDRQTESLNKDFTYPRIVSNDLSQFDNRPFKHEVFSSMPTDTTEIEIAKYAVRILNEKGFCVIDGLFTKPQIRNALGNIKKCAGEEKFSNGKVGGGKTSGEQEKQEVNADIRSDKIMWLEGTETELQGITSIVSRMDSVMWEFNKFLDKQYFINGRSKAMVACYPGNGSYYRRHVDNPHGDGRVVTCILYLNEDWNIKEDGGLLRILPGDSDNYIDVAPVANRLLFFWCDKRNPHEVHPAYKTRYAITVWYMDEEERKRAKQECLDGVATVTGESVLKECQQKQKERDKINQKMNDAATDAIASLSLDELQAISTLISGQQNADDILAGMGISPEIRTKLLKKLHDLEAHS